MTVYLVFKTFYRHGPLHSLLRRHLLLCRPLLCRSLGLLSSRKLPEKQNAHYVSPSYGGLRFQSFLSSDFSVKPRNL